MDINCPILYLAVRLSPISRENSGSSASQSASAVSAKFTLVYIYTFVVQSIFHCFYVQSHAHVNIIFFTAAAYSGKTPKDYPAVVKIVRNFYYHSKHFLIYIRFIFYILQRKCFVTVSVFLISLIIHTRKFCDCRVFLIFIGGSLF